MNNLRWMRSMMNGMGMRRMMNMFGRRRSGRGMYVTMIGLLLGVGAAMYSAMRDRSDHQTQQHNVMPKMSDQLNKLFNTENQSLNNAALVEFSQELMDEINPGKSKKENAPE